MLCGDLEKTLKGEFECWSRFKNNLHELILGVNKDILVINNHESFKKGDKLN